MEGWTILISIILLIIFFLNADKIHNILEKRNIYFASNSIKILSLFICGSFIISALSSAIDRAKTEEKAVRIQLEQKLAEKEEAKRKAEEEQKLLLQKWNYDIDTDEMTGEKIYFASCESKNTEYLEFPYEGGTKLILTIRNMNGKNKIYVKINKGQLQTYDKYVSIRLDNGKVTNYSLRGSSDGDSKFAFIYAGNSLISQFKKASVIKIQLPFYRNGKRTFTFEPGILEWNH